MKFAMLSRVNWAIGFLRNGLKVIPGCELILKDGDQWSTIDWRLLKPKMHFTSQEDPGPDSVEFHNHVYCDHGGLTLNTTNRRKMSVQVIISHLASISWFLNEFQAVNILESLFPQWEPLRTDVDPCAVCEAEISLSKEDKREVRRRVEDEKVVRGSQLCCRWLTFC